MRLAIIPARGGSKRIPRKNIKLFLGKPIIVYSIQVALNSGLFDEVMVSTDEDETAQIAKQYGAKVPFRRSAKNADDHAGTMDVILEVIDEYMGRGIDFDYICCLYPTAPLVLTEHLNEGLALLESTPDLHFVFPVAQFSYPIWRSLKRDANGVTVMNWPEHLNSRSQDLPSAYHDAGQWYWMRKEAVGKPFFGEKSKSIVLSDEYVQDIDNLSDWNIAALKYEYLQSIK
ncbi:pseudaminic acid cytidylyltransferase [Phaeodactylibacter xiamenensis]|uniref:pseudaminic acid cytidylyltransferase n=1 Tax=Phaeodactylibacter xiamenensis TaxID=1524460 RepID=UPI003BABC50D